MVSTPLVGKSLFGINLDNLQDSFWEIRRSISKRFLILEFQKTQLIYSEVKVSKESIVITKLNKVDLPEDAVDRGVPLEPEKMSSLIKEICKEDKIFAKRTIFILPPEASFSKLINLPNNLNIHEARKYINNPDNSIQIPIPLKKTDFDLQITNLDEKKINKESFKFFYLTTIPKKLTDQIIKTLDLSDLELQSIELNFLSQLKLLTSEISNLKSDEGFILLDLLKECSYVNFITKSGIIFTERITAIREFPQNLIKNEVLEDKSPNDISLEEIIYSHENYLPPSALDINSIFKDLNKILDLNDELLSKFKFKEIYLVGINSAHKQLNTVMEKKFKSSIKILRPVSNKNIDKINFNDFFIHQSLGSLIGASIGLKPKNNFQENFEKNEDKDILNFNKIKTLLKSFLKNNYKLRENKYSLEIDKKEKINPVKRLNLDKKKNKNTKKGNDINLDASKKLNLDNASADKNAKKGNDINLDDLKFQNKK